MCPALSRVPCRVTLPQRFFLFERVKQGGFLSRPKDVCVFVSVFNLNIYAQLAAETASSAAAGVVGWSGVETFRKSAQIYSLRRRFVVSAVVAGKKIRKTSSSSSFLIYGDVPYRTVCSFALYLCCALFQCIGWVKSV